MRRRVIVLLCTVALCLGSVSCGRWRHSGGGPLKTEALKMLDAIPMEYGSLVAVTNDGSFRQCAQLWFEKPDKTVVLVVVDWSRGSMWERAMTIPRR
jgi:hypothetical protein